jgi:protein-disulfide isomerase
MMGTTKVATGKWVLSVALLCAAGIVQFSPGKAGHHQQLVGSLPATLRGPRGILNSGGTDTAFLFIDFDCIHCRRLVELISGGQTTERVIAVRFFPAHGKEGVTRAALAVCAEDQGYFEAAYRILFQEGSVATAEALASQVQGLAAESLKACARSPKTLRRLQVDLNSARGIGVLGTPAAVIGDSLVFGIGAIFQLLLDEST